MIRSVVQPLNIGLFMVPRDFSIACHPFDLGTPSGLRMTWPRTYSNSTSVFGSRPALSRISCGMVTCPLLVMRMIRAPVIPTYGKNLTPGLTRAQARRLLAIIGSFSAGLCGRSPPSAHPRYRRGPDRIPSHLFDRASDPGRRPARFQRREGQDVRDHDPVRRDSRGVLGVPGEARRGAGG